MALAVTVPDELAMIVGERLDLKINFQNLIAPGDSIQSSLADFVYSDNGTNTSNPALPNILLGSKIDSIIDQTTPVLFGVSTNYSQHIVGWITPLYTETYTFYVTTDDGARLWIDGLQIMNSWINQSPTTYSGTIGLTVGTSYALVLEHYQGGGSERLLLEWQSASQVRQTVPATALDGAAFSPPTAIVQSASTNEVASSAIIGVPYASNGVILNVTVSSTYLRPKTDYVLKLKCTATGGAGTKVVSAILLIKVIY